eukprot:UN17107
MDFRDQFLKNYETVGAESMCSPQGHVRNVPVPDQKVFNSIMHKSSNLKLCFHLWKRRQSKMSFRSA